MDNSSILERQAQIRQNILKSVVPDETHGLFEKAAPEEEEDDLEKGGEGSKGGHVIGRTQSGKPIYETSGGGNSRQAASSTPAMKQAAEAVHQRMKEQHSSPEGKETEANHTSTRDSIKQKVGSGNVAISSMAGGETHVTVHERNHQAVHDHLSSLGYKKDEAKDHGHLSEYKHKDTGHTVSVSKTSNRSNLPKVYRD